MSAVEILAPGSQARTGTSSAFDATAFSTLRLDITARADQGLSPFCRLYVETAPLAGGPWRQIHERYFSHDHRSPHAWPGSGSERLTLAGFDAFVRCRWAAGRQGEDPALPATADIALVLGLAGDGQPDAAP